MQSDAVAIDAGNGTEAQPKPPAGKVRLLSLNDLDRRTAVYREVSDLVDRIESELGGRDRLSSARRQVIEAGALATAMRRDCMSSEHFGQFAWQFERMSGSSGLKVQAAIAC
jgi:hypothetical protein